MPNISRRHADMHRHASTGCPRKKSFLGIFFLMKAFLIVFLIFYFSLGHPVHAPETVTTKKSVVVLVIGTGLLSHFKATL